MRKMTFDEYDAMCERFAQSPYQCDNWWPSPKEVDEKIGGDVYHAIDFLIWVVETNEDPMTEAEKESKRYINKILRDNLFLYDKDDENPDSPEETEEPEDAEYGDIGEDTE